MDLVPTNEPDEEQQTDWALVEIEPFRNDPKFLEEILEQPKEKIAALITGAVATDAKGWTLIAGRLVQGAMRGEFLKHAAREIKALTASGEIPEDYAKSKYGFQTLAELLRFIDEEEVDEDRLLAVQAMFMAVNAIDAKEGERILHYQLFKIAKKLSASDLLLLKVAYEIHKDNRDPDHPFEISRGAHAWVTEVCRRLGHKVRTLIDLADESLVRERLLTARQWGDGSGINEKDARLTDLGIQFCSNIEKLQTWRESNREVS